MALNNMNQRELKVIFGKCSQRSWEQEIQELKMLNLSQKLTRLKLYTNS
jgi:hypothetical protein